jgi:hypothetical protein
MSLLKIVQISSIHFLEIVAPLYLQQELHNSIGIHQNFRGEAATPQKMHPRRALHNLASVVKSESPPFS